MTARGRKNAQGQVRPRKRSVRIGGHDTSVSLEGAFWDALGEIARARGISLNAMIVAVDRERLGNLSSALRLFVLESLRRRDG